MLPISCLLEKRSDSLCHKTVNNVEVKMMRPAHMARPKKSSLEEDRDDARSASKPIDDVAAWVQALIMALPALGYAIVYCNRWATFNKLGISSQLVFVRLEDILLIIAMCLGVYGMSLGNWIVILLTGRDSIEVNLKDLVHAIMAITVLYQSSLLVSISIKCHIMQIYQYIMLLIQIMILVISYRFAKRAIQESMPLREFCRKIACFIVPFLTTAALQASYLSFHTASYQLCVEDNALIIAYDEQGRAIEKHIVSAKEQEICELSEGYELTDITGKQLQLVNYGYIISND